MAQSDDDPIKKAKTLFLNQDDELAALLEDPNSERHRVALAALEAYGQLREEKNLRRRDNPWLLDLICVLYHSEQMYPAAVYREIRKRRKSHGIEPPENLEANVRHTYYLHCEGYAEFEKKKKKNPALEALFHSPEGMYRFWAVHHDRALAWLKNNRIP